MDIDKKDIEEFERLCKSRLEKGCKKYPNMLEKQNMFKEMSEELSDVSNYALLLYSKLKRLEERVKKKYKRSRI